MKLQSDSLVVSNFSGPLSETNKSRDDRIDPKSEKSSDLNRNNLNESLSITRDLT